MFDINIPDAESLVTTHCARRTGFLRIALEKNKISSPFVEEAHHFRALVKNIETSSELVRLPAVRKFMLSAAGMSDKSLAYLDDDDKQLALDNLNEKFLIPAGPHFVDEAIYRYLLIKGDAVGGTIRNMIGKYGEMELLRSLIKVLNIQGLSYQVYKSLGASKKSVWLDAETIGPGDERDVKAVRWINSLGPRVFVFNLKIPIVDKNVDLTLFSGYDGNPKEYARKTESALMMGELKGGIDPAGADEHWKTANSALDRIRSAFAKEKHSVKLSFVGAAIEANMAQEIFNQYQTGLLHKVANLTDETQLAAFSNWVVNI